MDGGSDQKLHVVLCWHMHQPWYLLEGRFAEPWTYLHALKDYSDMAAHLEASPRARAVVNFAPVLLEQLDLCTTRCRALVNGIGRTRDPLLDALGGFPLPEDPQQRLALLRSCLHVNEHRVLARYPEYREIVDLARLATPENIGYLSEQLLLDAVTWMHIAWLGEHIVRANASVLSLIAKGRNFDAADRRALLVTVSAELDALLPRYRALHQRGQIELSMSPWAHPIMPLLLDFEAARAALPHLPLPSEAYPGGAERLRWHIAEGQAVFERLLDVRPTGCWPSEGAICRTSLELLAQAGFRWAASGGSVLHNSLQARSQPGEFAHAPFAVRGTTGADTGLRCFFRDDGLSDRIGFTYKDWSAPDAIGDLVHHLENIARQVDSPHKVVTIAMDGENAWEHYPRNGYEFLSQLYAALTDHPQLALTTFSDYLDRFADRAGVLDHLVPGSWVYGSLSTWIGVAEKNRAWELLVTAKKHCDRLRGTALDEDIARALGVCEGSDWFWWLGENSDDLAVQRFDALYRGHLRALYRALGEPEDPGLDEPLWHPGHQGHVGAMRPSTLPIAGSGSDLG